MPLYEYECDACGGRFEVIQKFSETLTECRVCGKGPVRRLVAAPAFQFKGTGWYVTDYAQKGKSGGEAAADGTSGGAGKSDAKTSETKKGDAAAATSAKSDSSSTPAATTSAKE
jgi:putative FmdB family regulatory protein